MAAFKKYLLYGFGAIALMLIGILLNLQINNWNEARKAAFAEQAQTKTIANPFVGSWRLLGLYHTVHQFPGTLSQSPYPASQY